ncbi:MAG TPA: dTDP-4-dehydrorhamnose reductase [Rhabdochlamydiaceae bacterium]|nr:dTDP-4-dehydrorhamnose reductase [Rhabdochlamydiaceae bacterium]HSX12212.1 dTDP-4-dehydrorhamnose reductase [Rhabdochlamydiaceae bacterium]
MLIWILGSDGLLGRSMQTYLKNKQIPFFATNHEQADITQLKNLKTVAEQNKPTHLINCSAYNKVDEAEKQPELAFAVNVNGPENLGLLGIEFGIKVVHVSTDYVFSGEKNSPYLETDLCVPSNVYGISKREGEKKLLSLFPDACVVRTSWLFGKGGINFISKLPDLFKLKDELEVDTKQISRPTFCMDLAEALIDLLPESGIFHVAGGKPSSRFDIAEEMLEIAHALKLPVKCRRIKPLSEPIFSAPRPNYSVLDTKHTEKFLKNQQRPWKSAVQEFLKDV